MLGQCYISPQRVTAPRRSRIRPGGTGAAIARRGRPPNEKGGDAMSSLITSRRAISARENARKSTGPRPPAGKRRSAKNATTHAIFCQDLLHESEPADLFHPLRHSFLEELNPQTAL